MYQGTTTFDPAVVRQILTLIETYLPQLMALHNMDDENVKLSARLRCGSTIANIQSDYNWLRITYFSDDTEMAVPEFYRPYT